MHAQRRDSGHTARPRSLRSAQPCHLHASQRFSRQPSRFATRPPAPWPCLPSPPTTFVYSSVSPACLSRDGDCPGQNEVQEQASDREPRGRAESDSVRWTWRLMAAFLSLLLGGCKRFVERASSVLYPSRTFKNKKPPQSRLSPGVLCLELSRVGRGPATVHHSAGPCA